MSLSNLVDVEPLLCQLGLHSALATQERYLQDDPNDNETKAQWNAIRNGNQPPIKKKDKIPRNAKCPCGGEMKYKKCCGAN